jgi:hypothetical protein
MMTTSQFRSFTAGAIVASALLPGLPGPVPSAHAQSADANAQTLEVTLFVQTFPLKNDKLGLDVTWIPKPLQHYCLGKTSQQCATMDFCLRTTSPEIAMCKKLGSALTHMQRYPRDMIPRRMLSIAFLPPSTIKGFNILQQLAQSLPQNSLEHFSMDARIKARIQFTRRPDDDDFNLLEVLAASPF